MKNPITGEEISKVTKKCLSLKEPETIFYIQGTYMDTSTHLASHIQCSQTVLSENLIAQGEPAATNTARQVIIISEKE